MNQTKEKETDHYDNKEHTTKHATTGIKEYDSLKASVATLAGANTDGRNLYLDVEVFDGEHTNRFESIWPVDTTSDEVTEYLKSIIEKNPKLDASLVGIMQRKVFWNKEEQGWYSQAGNEKPLRLDKNKNA